MDDADADLREQIFHNNVREQIVSIFFSNSNCSRIKYAAILVNFLCITINGLFQIFLLLFMLLYLLSFMVIDKFRQQDCEDYMTTDDEEVLVYRISLWLCTFSLAICLGTTLLLPVSIVSNEILILYPNSYYVKWLNSSLIQGKTFIYKY